MSGGGTTAMSITCKRIDLSGAGPSSDPGNIPAKGVIEKNLFDSSSLSINEDLDQVFFNFIFHSAVNEALYEVTYYYNISPLNVNYPIYDQLKQQLLYIGYLTYCNL